MELSGRKNNRISGQDITCLVFEDDTKDGFVLDRDVEVELIAPHQRCTVGVRRIGRFVVDGRHQACMNKPPSRSVSPVRMNASLIFIFGAVPPPPMLGPRNDGT